MDEAQIRISSLLLQFDQATADRDSWQLAITLNLEPQSPFTNLNQHRPPDTMMGEQPFSKLLDPRWAEIAVAHLKEMEDYLDKRRKLQRGGKRDDT